jgi:hypothetical protein
MAIATATAIGLGVTAASAGMSFIQASKQRKLQVEAQESAKRSIADARKRLETNFYDPLSIVKEPYELEREALLSSGAQAIDTAAESDRGVAATAGRVQMAQNVQQGNIRTAMGRELMNLEKVSAMEDSRLRDENVILDLEETSGAQLAAANAWEAQQRALQQGFSGVSSMAGQAARMAPMNTSNLNLDTGTNTTGTGAVQTPQDANMDFSNIDMSAPPQPSLNGRTLNPAYQGMALQDIILQLQNQGAVAPDMNNIDYNQLYSLIYQ